MKIKELKERNKKLNQLTLKYKFIELEEPYYKLIKESYKKIDSDNVLDENIILYDKNKHEIMFIYANITDINIMQKKTETSRYIIDIFDICDGNFKKIPMCISKIMKDTPFRVFY